MGRLPARALAGVRVGGLMLGLAAVHGSQAPVAHAQTIARDSAGATRPDSALLATPNDESTVSRLSVIGAGILASSAGNIVIGSPKGWPQTWAGYSYRVADQVGFALLVQGVRGVTQGSLGWKAEPTRCPRPLPGQAVALRARVGCAVRETMLQRTATGDPRPNLPLFTGVVVASAASVSWRPERADPVSARAMFATRVAVVLGASMATKVVTGWWDDRRAR